MSLSPELNAELERLVAAGPHDADALKAAVPAHVTAAEKAFEGKVFFDASIAQNLGKSCLALLDADLNDEQRALAHAAVAFFVEDADEDDGDFTSVTGLDADVAVFNHVATEVGRPDLCVEDS